MRTARLAEPPYQRGMAGLEEDQRGIHPGRLLQLAERSRELTQEPSLAHVDDDRHLVERGIVPRHQLRHGRNQLRRQVVDTEVAEILEGADGLGLPGPRQAGEDDETPGASPT